jgi:hypothetical protein
MDVDAASILINLTGPTVNRTPPIQVDNSPPTPSVNVPIGDDDASSAEKAATKKLKLQNYDLTRQIKKLKSKMSNFTLVDVTHSNSRWTQDLSRRSLNKRFHLFIFNLVELIKSCKVTSILFSTTNIIINYVNNE